MVRTGWKIRTYITYPPLKHVLGTSLRRNPKMILSPLAEFRNFFLPTISITRSLLLQTSCKILQVNYLLLHYSLFVTSCLLSLSNAQNTHYSPLDSILTYALQIQSDPIYVSAPQLLALTALFSLSLTIRCLLFQTSCRASQAHHRLLTLLSRPKPVPLPESKVNTI